MESKKIYVTQPFLPPLEELIPDLREAWNTKVLTNNGPFHTKLELELCNFLGVPHISLFTNATIALVTALQALRITGEVITTPYSFVATAHSLLWNGLKPVFVDIDPYTMNLDPKRIEAVITRETTAIMPVHCYGQPCDIIEIQRIADQYNLKVIYDAAHSFAVYKTDDAGNRESILKHGDLSILSFHATKVFNTFEGGAIICPDLKTKKRIDQLKNFGFVDEVTVVAAGINGKMSEFNSILGLHQLKYIDAAIKTRESISEQYDQLLINNSRLKLMKRSENTKYNYSYYPIWIEGFSSLQRDGVFNTLIENNIIARRYFYPLISDFPMYRNMISANPLKLRNAKAAADSVICLPIHTDMSLQDVEAIVEALNAGIDAITHKSTSVKA